MPVLMRSVGDALESGQTADFGALTLSGAGGFKPVDVAGDEIELTAVTDQTGATRTWSISDGALVADGTPGVDDAVDITCSHATGAVVLTINAIAGAKSVRTDAQATAAIEDGARLLFRPVATAYTVAGSATGERLFQNRAYTSRTTIGPHYKRQVAIAGITNANPAVVTATAHGFSNGDRIAIRDVGGMTKINRFPYYTARNVTTNTLTLDLPGAEAVDTTNFGSYTSGGVLYDASSLPVFDHIDIRGSNFITVDGVEVHQDVNNAALLNIINGSGSTDAGRIIVQNCDVHGPEVPLTGDYVSGHGDLPVYGITTSGGSSVAAHMEVADNFLSFCNNGIVAQPTASLKRHGNRMWYCYVDSSKFYPKPDGRVVDIRFETAWGSLSNEALDPGTPHTDHWQGHTVTGDCPNVILEGLRGFHGGTRGDHPQVVFTDDDGTLDAFIDGGQFRAILAITGSRWGVTSQGAKDCKTVGCIAIGPGDGSGLTTVVEMGGDGNYTGFAGTNEFRYNVADWNSLLGTTVTEGLLNIGASASDKPTAATYGDYFEGTDYSNSAIVTVADFMAALKRDPAAALLDGWFEYGSDCPYVDYQAELVDYPHEESGFDVADQFTDVNDANTSTLITSAPVQVTGIEGTLDTGALVSVSGGDSPQFRITSDEAGSTVVTDWGDAKAIIPNNHWLWLRDTSSASGGTAVNVTVNVGTTSDTWTVTTA